MKYLLSLILALFLFTACQTVEKPDTPGPDSIDIFWKISKAQELVIHRQLNPDKEFYWADWVPEEVITKVKELADEYEGN